MVMRVDFCLFQDCMSTTAKHYSFDALQYIFNYEDEDDPDREFTPGDTALTWDEFTDMKDLINAYGYLTECGGYSYLQIREMTPEKIEEVVDEIISELQEKTHVTRLKNNNVLLMDF